MEHDTEMKKMHSTHQAQYLWVYWMIVILGIWMVFSPLSFDYAKSNANPAGDREIWLSLNNRILACQLSDLIGGCLLTILGSRSLRSNRPFSLWACCFIGIWISFSPLIFWAPNAFIYINDTVVGAWIIALTILIPGMPNMMMFMKKGAEVPSGWTYNPSSWTQRSILIFLGFFGWMVSRYLACFQLGYIDSVWDPFFHGSSVKVLTSSVSRAWPISDAGLGALAYTFEFLMGFMGGTSRWRTMPWMVTLFGILVIPLGLVSIVLVILQPLSVGAWCTFCLLTAALMLPMIPLEIDEVFAMIQYLIERVKKGESFWKVFWKGGGSEEENIDQRTPKLVDFPQSPCKVFLASLWGMSFPITLAFSSLLGIWMMFSPSLFSLPIENPWAHLNHLLGSLVIVFSVIAMAEILRVCRYINIFLGIAIAFIPFFLKDGTHLMYANNLFFGCIIAALAFPRGMKIEKYGLWDKYIK